MITSLLSWHLKHFYVGIVLGSTGGGGKGLEDRSIRANHYSSALFFVSVS